MVQNPLFRKILESVKEIIDEKIAAAAHGTNVRHALRCRNGVHRSVASLEACATIYRSLGFEVEVEHRSLGGRDCGCPDQCRNLQHMDVDRRAQVVGNWVADGHAAHVLAPRLFHNL